MKDGDNLIVTTEMKLPFDVYSDEEDDQVNQFSSQNPAEGFPDSSLPYTPTA